MLPPSARLNQEAHFLLVPDAADFMQGEQKNRCVFLPIALQCAPFFLEHVICTFLTSIPSCVGRWVFFMETRSALLSRKVLDDGRACGSQQSGSVLPQQLCMTLPPNPCCTADPPPESSARHCFYPYCTAASSWSFLVCFTVIRHQMRLCSHLRQYIQGSKRPHVRRRRKGRGPQRPSWCS